MCVSLSPIDTVATCIYKVYSYMFVLVLEFNTVLLHYKYEKTVLTGTFDTSRNANLKC